MKQVRMNQSCFGYKVKATRESFETTKKRTKRTIGFTAAAILASILTACPPAVVDKTIKGSVAILETARQMCIPITLQSNITDYGGINQADIKIEFNFGDGTPTRAFAPTDLVSHTFLTDGTFKVNVKASMASQVKPLLETELPVTIAKAPDCAYIVELKPTAAGKLSTQRVKALSNQIISETGGEELAVFTEVLQGFAARYDPTEASAVQQRNDVASASISSIGAVSGTQNTTADMWALDRIDQRATPLDGQYQFTTTGQGVDLYVMDTGVRASHQEFGSRVQKGYNVFTKNDATDDLNGHGTHVAAIAAGASVGVARNARIIPVKIFDGSSGITDEWAFVRGFDWIARTHNPARTGVVNLSAGMNQEILQDSVLDKVVKEFSSKTKNRNLLLVMAAGNKGQDACKFSPARAGKGDLIPVISVGASNTSDARTSISNTGECVDIYAPGENVRSASNLTDRDYTVKTGTSMASPFVAGAAAAYLESNPTANPAQVKAALIQSATKDALSNGATPNRLLFVDRPIAIRVEPPQANLGLLESAEFTAIVEGSANTGVNWEFESGQGTANSNTFKFIAGRKPGAYFISAISQADPSKRFRVPIVVSGGVLFKTEPSTMRAGDSQTLDAEVIGLSSSEVAWSVVPETAGVLNNKNGTQINFAPTDPGTYTVRVSSVADPSKTDSKQIRVNPAIVVNVSPDTIPIIVNQGQQLDAIVSNASNPEVIWTYSPSTNATLVGTGNSRTFLASATGVYSITATSVEDPRKSDTSVITVTAAPVVAVTVSPTSETMQTNIIKNFNATVQNASNTAVVWSVAPTANTTLNQSGNVASFSAAVAGEYVLTATSVADSSKSAVATVTVTNPPASVSVNISPSTNTIFTNTDQALNLRYGQKSV